MGVLIALLPAILGLLGDLLSSFLKNMQAAKLDPNTIAVINGYVHSAEVNPLLKTSDDKYNWVFAQAKAYFAAEGKVFVESLVNSTIEMLVQNLPSTLNKLGALFPAP